jgi:hypothetical protein
VPSVNSTLYYRWKKTATGGETSFTGTDDNSLTLAYTAGYESVFINGVLQVRGSDYTATTGTSITGLTALTAGDIVMVESVMAYSVGDTYTQSVLDGKFSPITTTGLVLVGSSTFSAVSSVTLNNCFSSAYANYTIECNYTNNTSGGFFNLRLASNGTPLVTNGYTSISQRLRSDASTIIYSTDTSSVVIGAGSNTNNSGGFNANIFNPFATEVTFANGFHSFRETQTLNYTGIFSGQTQNSTSYDGLVFLTSIGTITGTIKVYGYK